MKLSRLFKDFFNSEKTGGILLICCTCLSMILANSAWGQHYIAFWENESVSGHSIGHWINDGLMAIFFLLIGLELEREVYAGELSNFKNALFPVLCALGGVIIPAGIYFAFNAGSPTVDGVGIPMATDIAFAIGILSILGNKVPPSLKVFLTALAVIDDLCAIIVIAIFYTDSISFLHLSLSLGIFIILLVLNRLKIRNLIPYLIGGVGMWYFMLHSGVHATLSGVLLAFAIPFGNGDEKSTSYILQHFLHKPVAFIIIPLFALANTCIVFSPGWHEGLYTNESIGIIGGLALGKPIGIVVFGAIAVFTGICTLPAGLKWKHIGGVGFLGGIGFTMSIFITLLAFNDQEHISIAKISIIFASLISAVLGLILLNMILKKQHAESSQID
jgi:NhaA family Na+:H+ antiporter